MLWVKQSIAARRTRRNEFSVSWNGGKQFSTWLAPDAKLPEAVLTVTDGVF